MTLGGTSATLRVTSGFHDRHWRGDFYPGDLSSDGWLTYYAARFDTVEINNTFYHLPRARTFGAWRDAVRPGFCYALKFSRYGSHVKRLKNPRGIVKKSIKCRINARAGISDWYFAKWDKQHRMLVLGPQPLLKLGPPAIEELLRRGIESQEQHLLGGQLLGAYVTAR